MHMLEYSFREYRATYVAELAGRQHSPHELLLLSHLTQNVSKSEAIEVLSEIFISARTEGCGCIISAEMFV